MNIAVIPKNSYNLNQGQKEAADKFFEFLFSPDEEFIISGSAGVGKTFLMNYIIDETMPRYHEMCKLIGLKPQYDSVAMTATTNKAAEVLGKAVKRPTKTVHSFFNLIVKDNYETGQTTIKKGSQYKIHDRLIIFVDEASMIDTALWKMLHESTVNCKLVYVGDHNQLAPVHEIISPIYRHETPFVELLQPVRNSGQPALMEVCQQLRDTVATGEFKPIKLVPGVIDLLDGQQMQAEIDRHFKQQTHSARILAYTNKRVIEYNDHIRHTRGLPPELTPGEYVITSNVFHSRKGQIPVEMELTIVQNHGSHKVEIDKKDNVELDVDYVDAEDAFGDIWRKIPVPTNREHFTALVKYYAKARDWPTHFHLKNDYADLRPRDAATVHKSQGSTYDTVFIDLGNISTCHQPNQVARMLYVAFSRARSRIFLYGELAPKYGGLIAG
jgi:GTPase SAR1 family protein